MSHKKVQCLPACVTTMSQKTRVIKVPVDMWKIISCSHYSFFKQQLLLFCCVKAFDSALLWDLYDATFQKDNASVHVAHNDLIIRDMKHICLLPWPAWSPDFSPIENMWSMFAKWLSCHYSPIAASNSKIMLIKVEN